MIRRLVSIVILALIATSFSCNAFSPSKAIHISSKPFSLSSTQLQERRWNFNEGRSPWGLKNNAEIWNGRVAQVAFTMIFLQELIQGHGVVEGIRDGDIVNTIFLGVFAVGVIGLSAWLAIKGDDDFVDSI